MNEVSNLTCRQKESLEIIKDLELYRSEFESFQTLLLTRCIVLCNLLNLAKSWLPEVKMGMWAKLTGCFQGLNQCMQND